jgi:hypothetical protein
MNPVARQPSIEDVLEAFAVEANPNRETLERYLRTYPDYAEDLVDLSRELSREDCEHDEPLSAEEQALIDEAWRRHTEAAPNVVADPFVALSTAELREVARRLDVPRQVVTAFRERRVMLSTVPRRFLARFAEALNTTLKQLEATLSGHPTPMMARSYKADGKPGDEGPVRFERVLIEAGISEDKRARLMADVD